MKTRNIVLIMLSILLSSLAGCSNDDNKIEEAANFSQEVGTVVGTADFSEETPDISISNIKTYVGEEIDYSSGVLVSNTEDIENFQMWVDASEVDIYLVGTYKAVYKFVFDDNTIEKSIIVSVVEKNEEISGDDVVLSDNKGTQSGASNSGGNSNNNNSGNGEGNNPDNNNVVEGNTNKQTNGQGNNPSKQIDPVKPTNPVNPNNSSGGNNVEATKKQIITSSNTSETKPYTIGYMNIELLSGSVVKIKCTSSKFIVSTRTDVSNIQKDGVNYKVSKLIITYNTGVEQTLEAYEEKQ